MGQGRARRRDTVPEWGAAALARHDRSTARKAYTMGREQLGRPDALAAEVAQLAVIGRGLEQSRQEWARAAKAMPGYRPSAISSLSEAPKKAHDDILKQLDKEDSPEATRLSVALRARWGDPLGAFNSLMENLPEASAPAIERCNSSWNRPRPRARPTHTRRREGRSRSWRNAGPARRRRPAFVSMPLAPTRAPATALRPGGC